MSNSRFGLRPKQLHVEVGKAATDREGHLEHGPKVEGLTVVEMVEEGAKGVVLRDEPELRHSVIGHHIAGKETKDVVMAKKDGVIDLGLSEPRVLVT